MAIFRASTNHISRGKGHNAVAAAAYRAGEKLTDTNKFNPDATTYDYTNKKGVVATSIVLPTALSDKDFSINRQELWSSVEEHETTTRSVKGSRLKQAARLAREWLLALPCELSDEENEQLTAEFTQHLADELGVIGDYCIHKPTIDNYPQKADYIKSYNLDTKQSELTRVNDVQATEPDKRNIHAHIMFTTRKAELTADGKLLFGEKADSDRSELWRQSKKMVNGGDYIKQVRQLWADMVNKRLAQHEIALISHKSYKDLGLDIQPQHKEGKNATVLALYGSNPRVRGINNGYKEQNRAAIKSASDSCTTINNEENIASNDADVASNDANIVSNRAAATARESNIVSNRAAATARESNIVSNRAAASSNEADKWLSREVAAEGGTATAARGADEWLSREVAAEDGTAAAAQEADKWLSRAATTARGADEWLSRAAPTPFDRKQQSKKLDEQSSIFDSLAERANRVLARPIRPSAELIEQAIQKYWSIEEWRPTVQVSDWGGGGSMPNPESDPSDDFNHRQQVVIENIDKHLSGLGGDRISSDTLRRTLADTANKQVLTLLTDPEQEQFEHLQGLERNRYAVSVDEVLAVGVEPIPTNETQQIPTEKPPTPRNTYIPR